jgi:hypothetical protein
MELPYQTVQDSTLTHQVRFSTTRNVVTVSCNCRMHPGAHAKAGKLNASPMGTSKSINESRELYNNPSNHWAPFTTEDEAKW